MAGGKFMRPIVAIACRCRAKIAYICAGANPISILPMPLDPHHKRERKEIILRGRMQKRLKGLQS
jgi:hypothetical protein